MITQIQSMTTDSTGMKVIPVTVEIEIIEGLGIHLIGLTDRCVKECLLRTVTALQSCGYKVPGKKIVINLKSEHLPLEGSGFDLPVALGLLTASQQVSIPQVEEYLVSGELGLDGRVRCVCCPKDISELARTMGLKGTIRPGCGFLHQSEETDITVGSLTDAVGLLSVKQQSTNL